jgi:uncharacterized protein (TIGR00106 family)
MSSLVEFSMSPMDKGESLSEFVSRSIDIVDRSGVSYQLNAMGTIIEGDWDECMAVVRDCFERMKADCSRITCSIKIDYRAGDDDRLSGKVRSVEDRLGREIRTTPSPKTVSNVVPNAGSKTRREAE